MLITELSKYLISEESAIRYLVSEGIIKEQKKCYKCKKTMQLCYDRKLYRCFRKSCSNQTALFKHTFFATSKIKINDLLWLSYLYLNKLPTSGLICALGLGSEAVCGWTSYIRQLLGDTINFEQVKIGGLDIIVEIDETKLGKRKYNRGHRVDGVWVVGGVERTDQKKIFLQEVENRNYETILQIFKIFILPGSVVHTDGWAPYVRVCKELNLIHKTVNHKYHFKNPYDGTHTNTIEGTNNGLKHLIKPRNRSKKNINDWLYYFIWRRINIKSIWKSFIDALKEIIY